LSATAAALGQKYFSHDSILQPQLHEGNVSAARNFTTWQGTCYLTPLIGATLADSYWGKYRTIAVFSTIYFLVSWN